MIFKQKKNKKKPKKKYENQKLLISNLSNFILLNKKKMKNFNYGKDF